MALSGAVLSGLIQTNLTAKGFTGTELTNISNAIGNGIITASATLTFVTADLGTILGTGIGVGTPPGIKGMLSTNISGDIFNTGQGFWSAQQNNGPGIKFQDFCDAVGDAVISHFSIAATLASVHTTVLSGTGTVTVYTGVTIPTMKSAIVAAAPGSWAAAKFPELAEAVATGVVNELTGHTPIDIVIIGAGTPGAVPGIGTGIVT